MGRPTALSGRVSFAALKMGVDLAARGAIRALLTSPISKTAWKMAGIPYPGHTEYLAAAADAPQACMLLGSPSLGLWTALATRHIPLREVPAAATPERVASAARALHGAMRALGRPGRLGLCALNPHAGEGGLLGGEEAGLKRAASAARSRGIPLSGPLPADSAWREHRQGAWAGLVCLYHDQALMPLKALAGFGIVNWTAGLPFPRVSPGHGTAFDAVLKARGRPRPDPAGFVAAAQLAASLPRV